ncbi:MAG: hypothetical protein ABDK87_08945 [Atribacterota bacterium]
MRKAFLVVFALLVTLAYTVPFTLLAETPRFVGSFLFWIVFAGTAIGILFLAMRSWHE